MSGLCLDTPDSGPCSRKQAFDPNLIPEATATYQPLPNQELIKMIEDVAMLHGFTLKNEQLGMDLKGMRLFGVYDIDGHDFFDDRVQLMGGFCNSYNGSMSAKFCIGGKVFVCSNRCFHAYTDDTIDTTGMAVHPHRVNIRHGLHQRMDAAFGAIQTFRESQEVFFTRLEETGITRDEAYSTIVRAAQAGVINKTKILTIAQQWDRQGVEPETELQAKEWNWHREFTPRNAWSLFNSFTEIEKVRAAKNPVQSNLQTMALTRFFHGEYGVAA